MPNSDETASAGTVPSPASRDSVGLIGLGNMGRPLGQRLTESGCRVVAFDAQASALDWAKEAGLATAEGLADVAERCSPVLLSLPTPGAVRQVVPALVAAAPAGTVVVDLSTNDPGTAREMNAAAAERGVSYLDAPVSGGPSRARTGELTVMVGGDEAAVAAALPVLALVGRQVEHVGPSGAGTVAKLLNNFVAIWGMIGVSQAFLAAEALGVPLERFRDVLGKSSARSYSLDRNAPKILARNFKPDFSVELAEKDMRLALDLMRSAGIAPVAEAEVRGLFEAAAKAGRDRDVAALHEVLETGSHRERT